MDRITCLRGVISRLEAVITFSGEGAAGHWTVKAVRSGQSGEGYAERVAFFPPGGKVRELGSHLLWGNGWSRVEGDGSAAFLEISEGGDLMVRQVDYEGPPDGKWAGPTEPRRICGLDSIVKMEFWTTSGWHGECYPERVYNPAAAGGYREDDWLVILHRSTGAVTIEREFPF